MQPNKVSIPQLLADGTGFYVPFYQRAYVWKEKLWDRFIRDMEYISKTDEEYFIGSVILKKMGANGIETARWSVVDGQQRLTTLAIFYKVISLKNPNAHNPFDKYSLEHLMPQKWEENWKAPDNLNEVQLFDFKNTRNKTICTLGNLAIITLGLNSSISNSKWKKKVDGGLRDKAGDLITMKDVVNKSKWDEGTISARAEWLANKANLIWENVISSGEVEEEEIVNGRDTTQYSLDNGGTFLSKSSFVRTFIKLYIEKHPSLTINELKDIFKDSYLKSFKRIGFICTEDEINTKVLKNGRKPTNEDLDRWYSINDPEAWRISGDGIRFIPNNQMTRQSVEIIKGIAENDGWNIVVKRNS